MQSPLTPLFDLLRSAFYSPNKLMLPSSRRQGTTLTCQSSNNNLSRPLQHHLTIEMLFAPVDVSIVTTGEPFSAGKVYLVECEAAGSRPDPVITWWLGDTFISQNKQVNQKVGNITKSILTFEPDHGDDGMVLTCRAENTEMREGALQDSWKLTVYCE